MYAATPCFIGLREIFATDTIELKHALVPNKLPALEIPIPDADTACACGERQALLAVAQGAFVALMLGDIEHGADGAHHTPRRPFAYEKRLRSHGQPPDRTVFTNIPKFEFKLALACRRVMGTTDSRHYPLSVLGVNTTYKSLKTRRLIRADAIDRPHLGRPIKRIGRVIMIENTGLGCAGSLP